MKEAVNLPQLPSAWLSYSCYSETNRVEEQFVADHVFSHILEGSLGFYVASGNKATGINKVFQAGDMILVRRNQLAKFSFAFKKEFGQSPSMVS